MSNTATNVSASKPKAGGAAYRAPLATALPTDTTTALNAAFKSMGYISEDGLINSNSPENTKLKAWGGDTVLGIQTGRPDTFKFKMIESLNLEVLKSAYGDSNVTGALATGITVKVNTEDLSEYSWVFEVIMRGNVAKRIVIPDAKVIAVGDIVYVDNKPVSYDVTLEAYPDTTGHTHYAYIKAPAAGGGGG